MITAALLAAALLAEAPASTAPARSTPAPEAAAAKATARPNDDPMVCRTEALVGSRLPVRTCRPKSVWELYSRRSRDAAEDVQTRSHGPFIERP